MLGKRQTENVLRVRQGSIADWLKINRIQVLQIMFNTMQKQVNILNRLNSPYGYANAKLILNFNSILRDCENAVSYSTNNHEQWEYKSRERGTSVPVSHLARYYFSDV